MEIDVKAFIIIKIIIIIIIITKGISFKTITLFFSTFLLNCWQYNYFFCCTVSPPCARCKDLQLCLTASPWSKKGQKASPFLVLPWFYHPLWIINFVYYVKLIMHVKCKNSLLIIYELNNGDWPIRTWCCNKTAHEQKRVCHFSCKMAKAQIAKLFKRRQQKVWFFLD